MDKADRTAHEPPCRIETPSPFTRYGIKGMGEGGAIGAPAAIANAVNDALRPLGVEINETPLTPKRILNAIEEARCRQNGAAISEVVA